MTARELSDFALIPVGFVATAKRGPRVPLVGAVAFLGLSYWVDNLKHEGELPVYIGSSIVSIEFGAAAWYIFKALRSVGRRFAV